MKKSSKLSRLSVLETYPKAECINIATVRAGSKYFVVMNDKEQLGMGASKKAAWKASKKAAWKAAYRNINN